MEHDQRFAGKLFCWRCFVRSGEVIGSLYSLHLNLDF